MKNTTTPRPIDFFALLDPKSGTTVTLGKFGALTDAERRHCAKIARKTLRKARSGK